MWYKSKSTVMPEIVDSTSSQKYVYVRQNIEKIQSKNIISGETEIFYTYEEQKIPKEVYTIFEQERDNSGRLDDIEEVIANILGGEI